MQTFKFFSATVVADLFFGLLVARLGSGFRRLVTAFAHWLNRRMDADKGPDKGIFAGFQPHAISRIAVPCAALVGITFHAFEASLVYSDHNPDVGEVKYGKIPNFRGGGFWQHLGCVGMLPSPFDIAKGGGSLWSPLLWSGGFEIKPLDNLFVF